MRRLHGGAPRPHPHHQLRPPPAERCPPGAAKKGGSLAADSPEGLQALLPLLEHTTLRPRTAWYVVYRVLREEGLTTLSEREFTRRVSQIAGYQWQQLGFRYIPEPFKRTRTTLWGPFTAATPQTGRDYADLAQRVREAIK